MIEAENEIKSGSGVDSCVHTPDGEHESADKEMNIMNESDADVIDYDSEDYRVQDNDSSDEWDPNGEDEISDAWIHLTRDESFEEQLLKLWYEIMYTSDQPTHSSGDEFIEPEDWKAALNFQPWKESMIKEIDSLLLRGTWTLKHAPTGVRPLKTKWAFKGKRDENGNIYKLKSRLNACRYDQRFGVDYQDAHAPVGSRVGHRIMLALAAQFGSNVSGGNV